MQQRLDIAFIKKSENQVSTDIAVPNTNNLQSQQISGTTNSINVAYEEGYRNFQKSVVDKFRNIVLRINKYCIIINKINNNILI